MEVTEATDPYSRCTTADGERTIMVDLEEPRLQPPGWARDAPPQLSWSDQSIYELHIRDFRWEAGGGRVGGRVVGWAGVARGVAS
jgi:1,4-alpha-glucan branching enzyme